MGCYKVALKRALLNEFLSDLVGFKNNISSRDCFLHINKTFTLTTCSVVILSI